MESDQPDKVRSETQSVTHYFQSASAEMLAAILDQSLDCIKLIGPSGQLDFMNRNGRCAMEIDDFELVAGRNWWELWPESSRPLVKEAIERAGRGENHRFEAFCPTAKGTPRWWEVSVSPLRDASGEMQGIVSVSRDITDCVHSRELRETATAEIRHRLLNAYTLAGAIVAANARGSAEREEYAQEVLGRLERLGAAQALLLQTEGSAGIELGALLGQLIEPFRSSGCAFNLAPVPEVTLHEEEVRIVALIVGELSTNSNKYGALRGGGSITLRTDLQGDTLKLQWLEQSDGLRAAGPADGGGNGHRLIARALKVRGGSLSVYWREDGPEVRVILPLAGARQHT